MKDAFKRVSAEALPEAMKTSLSDKKVLKCFFIPGSQHYIAWIVNESTKRQQELEFDTKTMHFLNRAKRAESLEKPFYLEFQDLNVKVKVSYALEPETDVLHEELTVYSSFTGEPVANEKYVVFNAFKTDRKTEVANLLEKAAFPMQYSSWTKQEKIDYWSEYLYRIRRHAGEDGASLDSVFNTKLLQHMTEIDSNIIDLLPKILSELAKMEMTAATPIFAAFCARTKIELPELV